MPNYTSPQMRRLRSIALAGALGVVVAGGTITAVNTFTPPPPGQTYYVSASNGQDYWDGKSQGNPFRTIAKCAGIAQPGDSCIIMAGTYREVIRPPISGTAGKPITFQGFPGQTATLEGADVVPGPWTREGSSNVYRATVTLPISGTRDTGFFANQVFFDGSMMPWARWPNVTSFDPLSGLTRATAQSGTITGTVIDTGLPTTDIVGGINHYWGHFAWIATTRPILSASLSQLSFSGVGRCPQICMDTGTRYFITGARSLLDAPGEWFYDSGTHSLELWSPYSGSPSGHTILAKQRTWAVDLSDRSYITVKDLTIHAASITQTASSSYNTIDHINATYLSHFETIPENSDNQPYPGHRDDSGIVMSGTHELLENSTIAWSAGNGVALSGGDNTVTNNLIHDTDYSGSYNALIRVANPTGPLTVTHNTLYNTARDGINGNFSIGSSSGFSSPKSLYAYNDVWGFGILNQDLGGWYFCCGVQMNGTSIDHNWFHDSRLVSNGISNGSAGIYSDNGTGNLIIKQNVLWNTLWEGAELNGGVCPCIGGNQFISNTVPLNASTEMIWPLQVNGAASEASISGNILGNNNNIAPTGMVSTTTYIGNPGYIDEASRDYRLTSPLPGLQGAYPPRDNIWVPGCNFTGCQDPLVPNRHAS